MLCNEDLTDLFDCAGFDPDILTPGPDAASHITSPSPTAAKDPPLPPLVEGELLPNSPSDFIANDVPTYDSSFFDSPLTLDPPDGAAPITQLFQILSKAHDLDAPSSFEPPAYFKGMPIHVVNHLLFHRFGHRATLLWDNSTVIGAMLTSYTGSARPGDMMVGHPSGYVTLTGLYVAESHSHYDTDIKRQLITTAHRTLLDTNPHPRLCLVAPNSSTISFILDVFSGIQDSPYQVGWRGGFSSTIKEDVSTQYSDPAIRYVFEAARENTAILYLKDDLPAGLPPEGPTFPLHYGQNRLINYSHEGWGVVDFHQDPEIVAVYRDKYDDVYTVPLSPYINTSTVISDHLRRAAKMRSRERRRQHPRRQLTF